jgi:hypothetical protein
MYNNNNSRILVNINEDGEIIFPHMYIMINDNIRQNRNPINDLFNQPIFNLYRGLSHNTEINNTLNHVQMLDIMMGFFGDTMEDGYDTPLNPYMDDIREDRMMQLALRESLHQYKTQEKKPNIKLDVKSQLATVDHKYIACAICTSEFVVDETITILECNHILHTDCISEWVKYKSDCPVCRAGIATIDICENKISEEHENKEC